VRIDLSKMRYGFFHLRAELIDSAGQPLEAPRVTDFGITAAPQPSDQPSTSSFGIHGYPFALSGAKWARCWDAAACPFWSSVERRKGSGTGPHRMP